MNSERLKDFRQAAYELLVRAKDATRELMDAVMTGSLPILQVYKSMIEYIVFWENGHLASPKNMFESQ